MSNQRPRGRKGDEKQKLGDREQPKRQGRRAWSVPVTPGALTKSQQPVLCAPGVALTSWSYRGVRRLGCSEGSPGVNPV